MRPLKKVLHGLTTVPTNDCICLFVAVCLPCHSHNSHFSIANFLAGRQSFSQTESISIPRNVILDAGFVRGDREAK